MGEFIRLQKILAQAGFGSRRSCETFILEGRVTVDGTVVSHLGTKADPETQVITLDGEKVAGPGRAGKRLNEQSAKVYYALHKPVGVLCTNNDPSGRPLAIQMIPEKRRLFCVGRLDLDTAGLLLLTNDGELTHLLTHPRFGVPKTYMAKVDGPVSGFQLAKLKKGVFLAEGRTQGAMVRLRKHGQHTSTLEITIQEGLNRQVRRMLAAVGLQCRDLRRVKIGSLSLGILPTGAYRPLGRAEVEALRRAASHPKGSMQPSDVDEQEETGHDAVGIEDSDEHLETAGEAEQQEVQGEQGEHGDHGDHEGQAKRARSSDSRSDYGQRPKSSERRPWERRGERQDRGERRPYEKRPDRQDRGERRPYEKRPERQDRGERRPYEKRPDRQDRGERRPYEKRPDRQDRGERRPYEKRPDHQDRGERRPYQKPFERQDRGERRPYEKRPERQERGERRPYQKPFERQDRGERRPYEKRPDRQDRGERRPYEKRPERQERGERRPYQKPFERQDRGERRPFNGPREERSSEQRSGYRGRSQDREDHRKPGPRGQGGQGHRPWQNRKDDRKGGPRGHGGRGRQGEQRRDEGRRGQGHRE